mgnify:FL=1
MMELMPFLLILVCTDGYHCGKHDGYMYPMPGWETCLSAASGAAFSPVPETLSTGKRYELSFVVSAVCVGKSVNTAKEGKE